MDAISAVEGIILTELKKIPTPKGDVWHALKATDLGFFGFGEAYFTSVLSGAVKGWKRHCRMTMNLIVAHGRVTFFLFKDGSTPVQVYTMGEERYFRLTVPPRTWMAFRGDGSGLNLVLNIASTVHDPQEAENAPLEAFPLPGTP